MTDRVEPLPNEVNNQGIVTPQRYCGDLAITLIAQDSPEASENSHGLNDNPADTIGDREAHPNQSSLRASKKPSGVSRQSQDDTSLSPYTKPSNSLRTPRFTHPGSSDTELLGQYFNDIPNRALLTKKQEADLARAVQDGTEAAEKLANKGHPLSSGERQRCEEAVRNGNIAREHFIEANLRLVIVNARKYLIEGMSILDLIQAGNLGLMHAVEKFDERKGFKFSTYATWWIRQAIKREISYQSHDLHVPEGEHMMAVQARRSEIEFYEENRRYPDDQELAEELGIDIEKLQAIRRINQPAVRLDKVRGSVTDDRDTGLLDNQRTSENTDMSSEAIETIIENQRLIDMLASLTQDERIIIILTSGLGGDGKQTQLQIRERFGWSRNYVQETLRKARQKISKYLKLHEL